MRSSLWGPAAKPSWETGLNAPRVAPLFHPNVMLVAMPLLDNTGLNLIWVEEPSCSWSAATLVCMHS